MAEENISQAEEKCCLDDSKPMKIIEETSVETQVDHDVLLLPPAHVSLRRFSTGGSGKAQAQTRYRGNQKSSTHDLCKHGKRREDDDDLVIKPWKLVKKKNVESGDLVKSETLQVAKREACDGLRVKRSETKTPNDSGVVRKVKKTNLDVKKVSRISENKSCKEDVLKNLKKKEKTKKIDEPVKCDNVLEKTLYVVESSLEEKKKKKKSIKSEIQQSSEKKILRGSGKKSLELEITSRSKTGLSEKKEIGSVTNSKTESKIRPKRIGLKATPPSDPQTRPLSFKKGKVLEPKPEDLTPTLIKYKKRVVQEPKVRSDVNKKKKNLKDKGEVVGKTNGEGKREKVVLRHRKVETKKKMQTLFNNVIEETVNKLEEVRKSKVKALVGAFETVISLQDDKHKTSLKKKKIQSKSTSSQVVEG